MDLKKYFIYRDPDSFNPFNCIYCEHAPLINYIKWMVSYSFVAYFLNDFIE